MAKLLYIGSPQFNGIGLLNIEAQKIQREDELTILDGIVPWHYPEIRNFGVLDFSVWRLIRRPQFIGTLNHSKLEYLYIKDLNKELGFDFEVKQSNIIQGILNEAIKDHCICNNLSGKQAAKYYDLHWHGYYKFVCRSYNAIQNLLLKRNFSEVIVFNGRNTLARILIEAAKDVGIQVVWLEYFGSRDNRLTYIASPVDIFNLDAMSKYFLDTYIACEDANKEKIGEKYLTQRVAGVDPLLADWGMQFSPSAKHTKSGEKKVAAFFFSSEDEYPAVKPSLYGFQPPNEQYHAFSKICNDIVKNGLHKEYRFLLKLHPRYAVERKKLSHAQRHWQQVLENAREMGIDFQVVHPLESPYKVIAESDLVFSYGSTAWEATFLGTPAVLIGPNYFATHNCVYIANSVQDVISYLKVIPKPKPKEYCYPYAWAWRELGFHAQEFKTKSSIIIPKRLTNMLSNRFSKLEHAK